LATSSKVTETSTGNTFTAGALDLKVDSQSHFNGLVCVPGDQGSTWQDPVDAIPVGPEHFPQPGDPCSGTWAESDLIPDSVAFRFFNFDDLKPGDEGENTISLHVYDNDAWGCMLVDNVVDSDVTCTEPESEDTDDLSCTPNGNVAQGELGAALTFDAWLDEGGVAGFQCNDPDPDNNPLTDDATSGASCAADPLEGDNILNGVEQLFWDDETVDEASEGPFALSDVLAAANAIHQCVTETGHTDYGACHGLADDGRMVGSATYYWGLAWNIPESSGNEIQTDSLVMDMIFEVEQHRNNEDFQCTRVGPTTGSITIDKLIAFSDPALSDVDVTDFTFTLTGPGGAQVVLDEVENSGLPVGPYTISEVYIGDEVGLQIDAVFSGACTEDGPLDGDITLAAGQDLTCTITNNLSLES